MRSKRRVRAPQDGDDHVGLLRARGDYESPGETGSPASQGSRNLSEILGRPIASVMMTPSDLLAAFASGAAKSPPGVEENYAKSQLEWVQQTYDGRMDYGAVGTSTVQDLLGRPAMTLRDWVPRHREELLSAASS